MYFEPYLIRRRDGARVAASIEPATQADLEQTRQQPHWQTDWTSDYLADPAIEKYALKTGEQQLAALFQVFDRGGCRMNEKQNETMQLDELAEQAGGYFAMPSADDLAYTELLFDICKQFGIRYYTAAPKEKAFVEEVTRVTWARQQQARTGQTGDIRPAFSKTA